MKLRRAHFPAIFWTVAIVSTCLIPASSFSYFEFNSIFQIDKIVHFIMYAGFVILWFLSAQHWTRKKSILLLITAILLGILIEILQGSMRLGRSYDVADMIANAIGAILGVLLLPFFDKHLPLIKKYLPFMDKLYR